MTMEVEEWFPPVLPIAAVFLTNSNIEEVARWVKADYTYVQTDLKTRERRVEFFKEREEGDYKDFRRPGNLIVAARVGQHIMREDAHVDRYGDAIKERYYALSEESMQQFRREQKE